MRLTHAPCAACAGMSDVWPLHTVSRYLTPSFSATFRALTQNTQWTFKTLRLLTPQVLKSALQIVAAERGIKNAAAVAAAHAQHRRHAAGASRGATEDAADAPPAKRFAAAGPADTGATAITRPVAVARRGSSELSPRLSGQSAAQNNNGALYPAPSSAWPAPSGSLYPLPSVGTAPSHGYGGIGGFEAQRSTMSVRGADRGGAAPSVPEAIADVTALEVSLLLPVLRDNHRRRRFTSAHVCKCHLNHSQLRRPVRACGGHHNSVSPTKKRHEQPSLGWNPANVTADASWADPNSERCA